MSLKFGEKLRRMRLAGNLTLEQLAERIDSSKAYVWQLENKTNAKPSAEILLKIANALGKSPDFFLDDSRDEPSETQVGEAVFRKFNSLSEDDKRYIERMISGLNNEPKS